MKNRIFIYKYYKGNQESKFQIYFLIIKIITGNII